jgi:hypothetical protein
VRNELVPSADRIYASIEEVFSHGIRRPGYPADRWAEDWCEEQFLALGLENVRREPIELASWEPKQASLAVTSGDERIELPCFALPHCSPVNGLEAELVAFDPADPASVISAISHSDVPLTRMPQTVMKSLATSFFDPEDTFASSTHVLPFGREIMNVMEPSIAASAIGFIGVLRDYPGDSFEYYVPYDAVSRPIPGVWVRGSDGQRLPVTRPVRCAQISRSMRSASRLSATTSSANCPELMTRW